MEDVKEEVETLLDPYGCYRVYGRKDQTSASIMESELEQLDAMAAVVPVLFLAVAAIILYITMHRMMDQQRIQIGTMRAMGIPRKIIGIHYLGYGAFIGVLGGAAGGLLGNVCARPLSRVLPDLFQSSGGVSPHIDEVSAFWNFAGRKFLRVGELSGIPSGGGVSPGRSHAPSCAEERKGHGGGTDSRIFESVYSSGNYGGPGYWKK